ncbi:MAG: DUF6101 family protein [Beijerinckiaceae bacterium]
MNGQTLRGGPAPHGAGPSANDNKDGSARAGAGSTPVVPGFLHLRVIAGVWVQTRARATAISGISTAPAAHDPALIEIRLQLASGRSLALGLHTEETLIAAWRQASEAYGLPMLAREADGLFQPIIPMFGAVQIGADRRRRRVAALTSRRPRFLVRRKAACLPNRPAMVRGASLSENAS